MVFFINAHHDVINRRDETASGPAFFSSAVFFPGRQTRTLLRSTPTKMRRRRSAGDWLERKIAKIEVTNFKNLATETLRLYLRWSGRGKGFANQCRGQTTRSGHFCAPPMEKEGSDPQPGVPSVLRDDGHSRVPGNRKTGSRDAKKNRKT